ncbi:hypothetical protein D5045_14775 [Verminephrobacter eiseniae]|uniref:hypothetical protein n=1 Tax=Verminephrobacter eiseniae TaxID=364317 RepID=UPI00223872C0|nr:hypothetical protein [Verminephrobacter eiseniae]MCW5261394.1 hypothetical protein [Verminephrobacter eiseniae]
MPYIPIRIDFVEPGTPCSRVADNGRHHGFKSGTATFLLDEDSGQEYPFGPVCAGYMLGDKTLLRGIPDFTTRDFTPPDDEKGDQGSEGGGSHGVGASDAEKASAFAKRYLMLRMDRVANIPGIQPGIRYAPLAKLYEDFQQTRQLSDDAIRHIIALEKAEKTPAIYRSSHLLDVYTAYVQLSRQIKKLKPGTYRDTLVSIRDNALLRRLTLSDGQIRAARLRLHPQAFNLLAAVKITRSRASQS